MFSQPKMLLMTPFGSYSIYFLLTYIFLNNVNALQGTLIDIFEKLHC